MKEYVYVNDMGYHKKLIVQEINDKYHFQIWSMDTGDFCGCGEMTQEELTNFLKHYHFQG